MRITFSRLTKDSPGAEQAAEGWPFPSPGVRALLCGLNIHPQQIPARILSSELSFPGAL